MDHARLVEDVAAIAQKAAAAIMEVYGSADFGVVDKADDSPLTKADLNSHRVIVDGLRALTPDLPIVSEESELPEYETRRQWPRYWLVDPLDGTKEFISRNGEFTVNIALIEGHRPVMGVVAVPAREQVYIGIVPEGRAELRERGNVRTLATRRFDENTGPTIVMSRSHGGERLEKFVGTLRERFPKLTDVPVGSALKLCILAEGTADLYPRLGPTSEWDIGAAQAVLEAAGGAVWRFDRAVLDYNAKESLLNPEFLAVADSSYDWWSVLPSTD
jgi:3'(2'), 5'-bisphosphate nucleotidase